MDFVAVVDQAIALLRQQGRLTYRTLQLHFQLDEGHLAALKDERLEGQRLAVDEEGRVLVLSGETGTSAPATAAPAGTPAPAPLASALPSPRVSPPKPAMNSFTYMRSEADCVRQIPFEQATMRDKRHIGPKHCSE